MAFGDLSGPAGLKKLNDHLKTKSYIEGYQPSQSDTAAFEQIKSTPSAGDYVNVVRWFNHIKSFGDLRKKFPGAAPASTAANDDDDVDLFGSDDEEDAEAAKIKEQRLAEYAAKKSKKPTITAKSNVILDVKPWDDETDMAVLEQCVRSVQMEGLIMGASKLVPVGYGIKKLQITTVIEDDKVSVDELVEKIQEFEDYIQSVDIAAFNKI
jgi:elongation factor 1-beta